MNKMFIGLSLMVSLAFTANVASAQGGGGGNIFRNLNSTAGGNPTWDADMINIEKVPQTGAGVYVAVLDDGLTPNWRDYFPEARIATRLGIGFEQPVLFKTVPGNPNPVDFEVGQLHRTTWVGTSTETHGTHVVSTILGYFYRSNSDAQADFPLPPIVVRGIAPDVTIIPVKVISDYPVPSQLPGNNPSGSKKTFGTWEMIAAGINYATDLAIAGYRPMVINMSLGGNRLDDIVKAAIDRAIANGVIVVASAGNEGENGMSYPGAYPPVISAGAAGWTREWFIPGDGPFYRLWWLQYPNAPLIPGSGNVADPTLINEVYVSDFSSHALLLRGQQLDVLAPGSWVRGPLPGNPGYNHLPWWSKGIGDLQGNNKGNFYYVGGTSMASPHVASLAALILQLKPNLIQNQVEMILKMTALSVPPVGSRPVYDPSLGQVVPIAWDNTCNGAPCDAVGSGLIQADDALALAATFP